MRLERTEQGVARQLRLGRGRAAEPAQEARGLARLTEGAGMRVAQRGERLRVEPRRPRRAPGRAGERLRTTGAAIRAVSTWRRERFAEVKREDGALTSRSAHESEHLLE